MKDSEIAKIELHYCYTPDQFYWYTIEIFNKVTKKHLSGYGPFYSIEESTIFAQEHHINL